MLRLHQKCWKIIITFSQQLELPLCHNGIILYHFRLRKVYWTAKSILMMISMTGIQWNKYYNAMSTWIMNKRTTAPRWSWRISTHRHWWRRFKGSMVVLGPTEQGTRRGSTTRRYDHCTKHWRRVQWVPRMATGSANHSFPYGPTGWSFDTAW